MKVYSNGKMIEVGGGSAQDIYSTEEQVVGRWIDGKPLYRKVIETTSPSQQDYRAPIAILPNIIPINIYGSLIVGDSYGSVVPLNSTDNTDSYTFTWYLDNSIQMKQAHKTNAFTSKPVYLVVEYIKTTDQATRETQLLSDMDFDIAPQETAATASIILEEG